MSRHPLPPIEVRLEWRGGRLLMYVNGELVGQAATREEAEHIADEILMTRAIYAAGYHDGRAA